MTDDRIILKGNSKLLRPIITQLMAINQMLGDLDLGGSPHDSKPESIPRKGKPKITLFFLQDSDYARKKPNPPGDQGRRRVEGVISFRLMDESTASFSKANAKALASKIKQVFGSNGGYTWKKGKTMYSYSDWDLGYQFQLLCRSTSEAKRIVSDVLSLQNHTPDWQCLNIITNDQEATRYPENPGKQIVMGEEMPRFRRRPNVDVRFRYAYTKLSGTQKVITLYDHTHRRVEPLVE